MSDKHVLPAVKPLSAAELGEAVRAMLEKPLPAVTHSGRLLHQSLKQSEPTYKQMAEQIQNDPVLALTLIRNANSSMRDKGAAIRNIPQAISLMGVEKLSVLLQATGVQLGEEQSALSADSQRIAWLEAALGRSLCAAEMAKVLFSASRKSEGETLNAFWGTLFWGSPYWYLWYYSGDAMQHIRQATRRTPVARGKAVAIEIEALGFDIRSFWREAHRQMALPVLESDTLFENEHQDIRDLARLTSAAKQGFENGSPRALITTPLRRFCKRSGFTETLLNQLVEHASVNWHSSSVNRCVFALAARWKASPVEGIRGAHEAAVSSARKHPLRHGVGLATALLDTAKPTGQPLIGIADHAPAAAEQPDPSPPDLPPPDQPQRIESRVAVPSSAMPKPAKPSDTPSEKAPGPARQPPAAADIRPARKSAAEFKPRRPVNRALFNQAIHDMLTDPLQFAGLPDLMGKTIDCVAEGMGIDACIISLITADRSAVKSFFCTPLPEREHLVGRQMLLNGVPLFAKLMRKPATIWVNESSSTRIRAHLSDEFRDNFRVEEFFASSCFVGDRPIGLIYVDNGPESNPMTPFDYESFKELCNATSQVVYNLAHRARSK